MRQSLRGGVKKLCNRQRGTRIGVEGDSGHGIFLLPPWIHYHCSESHVSRLTTCLRNFRERQIYVIRELG